MTSESQYSRIYKLYISGATTDYANNLSRFTAQMEFTVMKLNDLQESYSNYEPNITAFMQLKYNGILQI
jgi:hypothetical protein